MLVLHICLKPIPMKRASFLYLTILACFLSFLLFAAAGKVDSISTAFSGERTVEGLYEGPSLETPQRVRPPRLKGAYNFAGEPLPMEDMDIRKRLDRELLTNTFYHSSTQHILKHKTAYFPIIESILREEGVPEDLKYIAVAESAFRDFRSPAGASGVWHFMKGTAKQYGLEVNGEVDERYHLEKATRAAAKFLKDLKQQMGSWTLAAAAYNRGASGVKNKIQQQRAETYYDLNLNAETARYVFRIVALKDIIEDPGYYGFFIESEDTYQPDYDFATVTVTESVVNWGDFARQYGTTYRKLKVLNPWLRDVNLTVSRGNSYEIRIPRR